MQKQPVQTAAALAAIPAAAGALLFCLLVSACPQATSTTLPPEPTTYYVNPSLSATADETVNGIPTRAGTSKSSAFSTVSAAWDKIRFTDPSLKGAERAIYKIELLGPVDADKEAVYRRANAITSPLSARSLGDDGEHTDYSVLDFRLSSDSKDFLGGHNNTAIVTLYGNDKLDAPSLKQSTNDGKRVLCVSRGVNLRLENVTIENGNLGSNGGHGASGDKLGINGGGAYIEDAGFLTLGKKVVVRNNTVTNVGVGNAVYYAGGSLALAGNVTFDHSVAPQDIFMFKGNQVNVESTFTFDMTGDPVIHLVLDAGSYEMYQRVLSGTIKNVNKAFDYVVSNKLVGYDATNTGYPIAAPVDEGGDDAFKWHGQRKAVNDAGKLTYTPAQSNETYFVDPSGGKDDASRKGTTKSDAFKTLNRAIYEYQGKANPLLNITILGDLNIDAETEFAASSVGAGKPPKDYLDPNSVITFSGMGAQEVNVKGLTSSGDPVFIDVSTAGQTSKTRRAVMMKSGVKVYFERIVFKGGDLSSSPDVTQTLLSDGAGIYVSKGAFATMGDGVQVYGNKVASTVVDTVTVLKGKGVGLYNNGTLWLTGSAHFYLSGDSGHPSVQDNEIYLEETSLASDVSKRVTQIALSGPISGDYIAPLRVGGTRLPGSAEYPFPLIIGTVDGNAAKFAYGGNSIIKFTPPDAPPGGILLDMYTGNDPQYKGSVTAHITRGPTAPITEAHIAAYDWTGPQFLDDVQAPVNNAVLVSQYSVVDPPITISAPVKRGALDFYDSTITLNLKGHDNPNVYLFITLESGQSFLQSTGHGSNDLGFAGDSRDLDVNGDSTNQGYVRISTNPSGTTDFYFTVQGNDQLGDDPVEYHLQYIVPTAPLVKPLYPGLPIDNGTGLVTNYENYRVTGVYSGGAVSYADLDSAITNGWSLGAGSIAAHTPAVNDGDDFAPNPAPSIDLILNRNDYTEIEFTLVAADDQALVLDSYTGDADVYAEISLGGQVGSTPFSYWTIKLDGNAQGNAAVLRGGAGNPNNIAVIFTVVGATLGQYTSVTYTVNFAIPTPMSSVAITPDSTQGPSVRDTDIPDACEGTTPPEVVGTSAFTYVVTLDDVGGHQKLAVYLAAPSGITISAHPSMDGTKLSFGDYDGSLDIDSVGLYDATHKLVVDNGAVFTSGVTAFGDTLILGDSDPATLDIVYAFSVDTP